MPWKKVTSTRKSASKKAVLKVKPMSQELIEDGVIDRRFEIMLYNLSLDEIISLKLEQAVRSANYKLFGIPLLEAVEESVRLAVIRYAFSVSDTTKEVAAFLGLTQEGVRKLRDNYSWLVFYNTPRKKHEKELKSNEKDSSS